VTALAIRFGVSSLLLASAAYAGVPEAGIAETVVWLLASGPLLRRVILPLIFPVATCPGCRRTVPLVGRWKCGDHYTDHRDRHILAFFCAHGHRLEGFDCPRCRATIMVQKGDRQLYRHGSAIRLRVGSSVADRDSRGVVIGHNERRQPIYLPYDRLAWHVAVTGGTGRGKSTLLLNLACQLIRDGAGLTVLDPGGDLARAVLSHVSPDRERDALYVDVADRDQPFPLNVLSAQDASEGAVLVEELLGVFRRLHGTAWGPLLAHQLRMGLKTAMFAGGSLRDVLDLFTDDRARARLVARLGDPDLRKFWTSEFPGIPAVRRAAVVNKIAPVVMHPILGPVLSNPSCALDTDELVARKQILIVNLASGSPGPEVTELLGTFLVQKVLAAAFRQVAMPEGQRVPHILIVDEFQRFMHRAAAFDQILAETRKFRLALLVANQYVEQLAAPVRAALFGNVGCLVAFRAGHRDAKILTPEFIGARSDDLLELERGQCLVRIGTDWNPVRTFPPPARLENDPTGRILARTRQRPAKMPAPKVAVAVQRPDAEPEFVH
jgi:hypothetical protein